MSTDQDNHINTPVKDPEINNVELEDEDLASAATERISGRSTSSKSSPNNNLNPGFYPLPRQIHTQGIPSKNEMVVKWVIAAISQEEAQEAHYQILQTIKQRFTTQVDIVSNKTHEVLTHENFNEYSDYQKLFSVKPIPHRKHHSFIQHHPPKTNL
jgi:hypothetical protein